MRRKKTPEYSVSVRQDSRHDREVTMADAFVNSVENLFTIGVEPCNPDPVPGLYLENLEPFSIFLKDGPVDNEVSWNCIVYFGLEIVP